MVLSGGDIQVDFFLNIRHVFGIFCGSGSISVKFVRPPEAQFHRARSAHFIVRAGVIPGDFAKAIASPEKP